jgi:hypothetical protein
LEWSGKESTITEVIKWSIVPAQDDDDDDDDDDECGAISGMLGRGDQSMQKPAPVPLFPTQTTHDLIQAETRAAAMGSQRLTAQTTAWPKF